MLNNPNLWQKLGRIVKPDPSIWWLNGYAGSSFAQLVDGGPLVDLYVSGRDEHNRSHIGRIRIDITQPQKIQSISAEPVLKLGDPGAFDENGTTYPFLVQDGGNLYMYYTGWMPSVITPFQNHLGMAQQQPDGTFERVSRAPILPRDNDDYLSIGSSGLLIENGVWHLWYTAWTGWGADAGGAKHRYVIKYATSRDGRCWHRDNIICIEGDSAEEHSICRPSVIKHNGIYHMWYAKRGDQYRIGYAHSADCINWTRRDDLAAITPSAKGWDSEAQAYPNVFRYDDSLYMIYNGNHYGRDGLGLARMEL